MANIGSLVADLRLNSSSFNKNIKDAERTTKSFASRTNRSLAKMERSWDKFGKSVKHYRKKMLNLKTVIGSVAGASGLGYLVYRNLEAADAIAKTADSIGISTSALQKYRYIAERSGVETSALEQGFSAFTKRLGELKNDTGALNTILKKNNNQLREQLIQTNSTSEALDLYFRALQGIENQSERAALSSAAFSRTAGVAMTNMIDNVETLSKRYERLDIEIKDGLLRNTEQAKDNIDDLSLVVKNSLTAAVASLAPEIGQAATNMSEWVSSNKDFITQDIPSKIREFGSSIEDVVNSKGFQKLIDNWEVIAATYFGGSMGGIGGAVGGGMLAYVLQNVEEMTKNWGFGQNMPSRDEAGFFNFLYDKVGSGGGSWGGNVQTNQNFAKVIGSLNNMDYRLQGTDELTKLSVLQNRKQPSPGGGGGGTDTKTEYPSYAEMGFPGRGWKDMWLSYAEGAKKADKRAKELNETQKETAKGFETVITYGQQSGKEINTIYAGLNQGLAEYSRRYGNVADRIKNMTSSVTYKMESSFTNFLDVTSDKFLKFGALVEDVLGQIQKQLIRSMIVQPLISNLSNLSLGGGMNTGAPAHVGAGGTTAFGMHSGGIVGADYSFTRDVPKFHSGGVAANETPAILKNGEGVFTQEQMKAMGNVNVQVIDQRQSGEQIEAKTENKNGKTNVTLLVRDEVRKTIGTGGADKTMRNSFNIDRSPIRR